MIVTITSFLIDAVYILRICTSERDVDRPTYRRFESGEREFGLGDDGCAGQIAWISFFTAGH